MSTEPIWLKKQKQKRLIIRLKNIRKFFRKHKNRDWFASLTDFCGYAIRDAEIELKSMRKKK